MSENKARKFLWNQSMKVQMLDRLVWTWPINIDELLKHSEWASFIMKILFYKD